MTTTVQTPPALAEPAPLPRRRRRAERDGFTVNWWITALMLVASLTVLVPLYFSIVMALKTPEQIANGSGFELPNPVQWSNFSDAYTLTHFPKAFLVTAVITVVTVPGSYCVVISSRPSMKSRRFSASLCSRTYS